jgi:hypothetical protein
MDDCKGAAAAFCVVTTPAALNTETAIMAIRSNARYFFTLSPPCEFDCDGDGATVY